MTRTNPLLQLVLSTVLIASLPATVFAQTTIEACEASFSASPFELEKCKAKVKLRNTSQVRVDPSLSSASRTNDTTAVVLATQDKTTAAIELQLMNRDQKILSLKVAGNLDKDGETELVDLDGLVGKTTATLSFHRKFGLDEHLDRRVETGDLDLSSFVLCRLVQIKLRKDHPALADQSCKQLLAVIDAPETDDARKELAKAVGRDPSDLNTSDVDSNSDGYQALIQELRLDRPLWSFDLAVSYAPESTFQFVTADSLAEQSEKHDGFGVTLAMSMLPGSQKNSLWSLAYRYEESYKDNSKQQICSPFGTVDGALTCSERVVGAPRMSEKQIASLEFRHLFYRGSGSRNWALAARLSHDFENDVTAFQLPVWFLTDSAKKNSRNLTGGVALGWDSENEDVTLTAFVGALKTAF